MAGFATPRPLRDRPTAPSTHDVPDRLRRIVPQIEWAVHEPHIAAINRLKAERNAIILGHNYMTPEIFHGVADLCGDSLALASMAAETHADVIVLAGVHFMAETAKLLSPEKTVLIPDVNAGCSLAESITAADIELLRRAYPGVPVVTYVNTSAEVKAASDICCTSGNAVEVVESLGVDRVIFLPDEYLGKWVATQTDVDVIVWQGHCEVHERFTGAELRTYRAAHPGLTILAHPECPPDVLVEADYVGSTAGMARYVTERQPPRVVMITECSMSDNVAVANPGIEFVRPCNLCPHMKRITLPKIRRALETMQHEVVIDGAVARRARRAVERMLEVKRAAAA
jgi:quinolinate synthase